MTIKTKAADRVDGQAAHETVRAGQSKHSTRRADPVAFILLIDNRYRLTADELPWRIERRKGKYWRAIEWHSSITVAANSLGGRLLRTADVRTVADALAAVDNVARTLTLALAPSFKVEVRS
ncbi:MAG: hypothetical protein H0V34_03235 [Gammaproteobacteria bacterium]|nr:hypothetical protein [Gammaproteobacteria bacterium]